MLLPSRPLAAAVPALALAACAGEQSWIDPAGRDAETVATLFWVLVIGAVVIWAGVMVLAAYAGRVRPGKHSEREGTRLILWGGIVFPTVTIAVLMTSGLFVLEAMTDERPQLRLHAEGEQWWWRIHHIAPDGTEVPTPNELRLPAGRDAELVLTAHRVIHSFWVPSIGGKMDMIPGRVNRLTLSPTRPGVWRGQCAEFCGEAHAQMTFPVVIMEPADFDDWLTAQAEPARAPETEAARRGLELFLANGCGGCHTIRGTEAEGDVGPDLTHVGSRLSIGAGLLPVTPATLREWIAAPEEIKPGVRMPAFGMLPDEEIALIADYLAGLE